MTIVITGASKGFGKAIAEIFASNGYDLFLCSRNVELLSAVAEELMKKYPGINIKYKSSDLSNKSGVRDFGKWLLDLGTEIDVLVNNAGQFIPGSVYNEKEGVLEQMININLFSAYHLTRLILPAMIQQGSGHIFNICSIASLKAYNNGGAYSISKYALAGFSANLREEMKPHGIKVTSVFPGAAYTGSWEGAGIQPDRIMEAADVAKLIYCSAQLSVQACVEEILVRPQLGDL